MADKDGHRHFGNREADLRSELYSTLVDAVVNMARTRNEWNKWVDALRTTFEPRRPDTDSSGNNASGQTVRLRNLAFELAETGVYGWRDLLDVQKRFQPELAAAQVGPGLAWLDPLAELVSEQGVLRFPNPKAGVSRSNLVIENRSAATVELLFPRFLELVRSDDGDRVLLDLDAEPAVPVLMPGDQIEQVFSLVAPPERFAIDRPAARYLGTLVVRTRTALQLELPVELVWAV